MTKYIIMLLSVILITASCNKKPVINADRQDMLRSGKWTIQSGTITLRLPDGRDTTLNYLNFLPRCHQDDYMIFHGGSDAAIFSGGFKCSPGDPDSVTFKWGLTNNDNTISMYHGWDFVYSVTDSILPFVFDTISQAPLVLDTIHGVNDTLPGFTRTLIVLDTIWQVQFDSTGLVYNDIYNASITSFSASSFTINFWIYSTYRDSTGNHTAMEIFPGTPPDTVDKNPVVRPDTFKYTITYING